MKLLRFYFVLVLSLVCCAGVLYAQTVYVNSSTGSDGTGTGSSGSPYKTFTKGYSMVSAGGTLDLTGTFTWTDAAETGDVATSEVVNGFIIDKNITIRGQGADHTIIQAAASSGTASTRLFYLASGGITVTFQDLELQYGKTTYLGGALYLVPSTTSTVTLLNCYIHDNIATEGGCGIEMAGSVNLTITNSTISSNSGTNASGGGIRVTATGTLIATNSTICNNTATQGSGNGLGAGIYFMVSTATSYITNCTITGNSATATYGGGLCQDNGTVYLKNNIIANNTSTSSSVNDYEFWAGTLVDNGNNIIEFGLKTGSGTGNFSGTNITGNQTNLFGTSLGTTPSLALNNTANGTPTLKTTSGSVAINAGSNTANGSVSVPTTDQRGGPRNGGTTDIGAYEYWTDDGALPVELASFTAMTLNNSTTLAWKTATETNNYGFEIERRTVRNENPSISSPHRGGSGWGYIGFVQGAGTNNTPKEYSYTDAAVASGTYAYRLKQIDNDGTYKYSGEAEVTVSVPNVFALNQNYPNPFNPSTTMSFTLAQDGYTTLKIYDVLGKEVATLIDGEMKAGVQNTVTFDASKLSSGVYFLRLASSGNAQLKKMLLLK